MNLNSKKTQNIIIGVLSLALVTTVSVEAMINNRNKGELASIKERAPIKNSLKDYIVDKVDINQEIENELNFVIDEEIKENVTTEEPIYEEPSYEEDYEYGDNIGDTIIDNPNNDHDSNTGNNNSGNTNPPSEDTGSDIPDGNLPGTGDKPTPPPSTGDGGAGGDHITKPDVPGTGVDPETPLPPQPPIDGDGNGSTPEFPEEDNENINPELP